MHRPNILLMVVDQLRYDCVGFARRYPVRTPNLDRLAARSTWFSHAFTPIPTCCPARQSFLTGQRPEALGTLWNYDLGSKIPSLGRDVWTWSKSLSASGYATGYVGKWHVSDRLDPTDFGFDTYVPEAEYDEFRAARYPDEVFHAGYFGEDDPQPLEDARTHWLADRAIDRMKGLSTGSRPWLLRLDLTEPHLPCRPAAPFSGLFGPGDVPQWASFGETFENKPYIQRQQLFNWRIETFDWSDWAPIVARYYNIIAQVDDAVGRMLSALSALGHDDDTVVIFTSDHGDMCGAHRMLDKHYVLYDDVVHVPLIVHMPGQQRGVTTDAFVSNMLDLAPTLAALGGGDVPAHLHGTSLLPLLSGDPSFVPRADIVSTYNGQQFGLYSQRMLRERRWKYVWNATDVDELYDLEADPAELRNLIADPGVQGVVERMRRRLHAELKAAGDSLIDNPWLTDQMLGPGRKIASEQGGPIALPATHEAPG